MEFVDFGRKGTIEQKKRPSFSTKFEDSKKHKSQVCITFCRIRIKKYQELVTALGGKIVSTVAEATHIVAPKHVVTSSKTTNKIIEGRKKGIPILTEDWLNDSQKNSKFLPDESYVINFTKSINDTSSNSDDETTGTTTINQSHTKEEIKETISSNPVFTYDLNEPELSTPGILSLSEALERANRLLEEANTDMGSHSLYKEHWIRESINNSLSIIQNQLRAKTVFVGESGVGKSFMLNLLMRLTCISPREYESGIFILQFYSYYADFMQKRRGAKRVSGQLMLEGNSDGAQVTYLSPEWCRMISKLEISSDDVRRFCFTVPSAALGKTSTNVELKLLYGSTFHVRIEYHDQVWAKNTCWNAVVQYQKMPGLYMKPGNSNKILFEKLHEPNVPIGSVKSEDDIVLRPCVKSFCGKITIHAGSGDNFDADRNFVRDTLFDIMDLKKLQSNNDYSFRTGLIKSIIVYLPSKLLEGGAEIVDAPGINDLDPLKTMATREALADANSIVMVVNLKGISSSAIPSAFKNSNKAGNPGLMNFMERLISNPESHKLAILNYTESDSRQGLAHFQQKPTLDIFIQQCKEAESKNLKFLLEFLEETAKNYGFRSDHMKKIVDSVHSFSCSPLLFTSLILNKGNSKLKEFKYLEEIEAATNGWKFLGFVHYVSNQAAGEILKNLLHEFVLLVNQDSSCQPESETDRKLQLLKVNNILLRKSQIWKQILAQITGPTNTEIALLLSKEVESVKFWETQVSEITLLLETKFQKLEPKILREIFAPEYFGANVELPLWSFVFRNAATFSNQMSSVCKSLIEHFNEFLSMQFLELIRREELPESFALHKARSSFHVSVMETFRQQSGFRLFMLPQTIESLLSNAQSIALSNALKQCKIKSEEYKQDVRPIFIRLVPSILSETVELFKNQLSEKLFKEYSSYVATLSVPQRGRKSDGGKFLRTFFRQLTLYNDKEEKQILTTLKTSLETIIAQIESCKDIHELGKSYSESLSRVVLLETIQSGQNLLLRTEFEALDTSFQPTLADVTYNPQADMITKGLFLLDFETSLKKIQNHVSDWNLSVRNVNLDVKDTLYYSLMVQLYQLPSDITQLTDRLKTFRRATLEFVRHSEVILSKSIKYHINLHDYVQKMMDESCPSDEFLIRCFCSFLSIHVNVWSADYDTPYQFFPFQTQPVVSYSALNVAIVDRMTMNRCRFVPLFHVSSAIVGKSNSTLTKARTSQKENSSENSGLQTESKIGIIICTDIFDKKEDHVRMNEFLKTRKEHVIFAISNQFQQILVERLDQLKMRPTANATNVGLSEQHVIKQTTEQSDVISFKLHEGASQLEKDVAFVEEIHRLGWKELFVLTKNLAMEESIQDLKFTNLKVYGFEDFGLLEKKM